MNSDLNGVEKAQFKLTCDIVDTEGSIARLATILADNHINIKNIGIIYNREFEHGALRIEFYDESALNKAASVLTQNGYTIHN